MSYYDDFQSVRNKFQATYSQSLAEEKDPVRRREHETTLHKQLDELEQMAGSLESARLEHRAKQLDILLPPRDDIASWTRATFMNGDVLFLSGSAREEIRKKINEVENRLFEKRARWAKVLIPAIAPLTGLIGAITGLIALVAQNR